MKILLPFSLVKLVSRKRYNCAYHCSNISEQKGMNNVLVWCTYCFLCSLQFSNCLRESRNFYRILEKSLFIFLCIIYNALDIETSCHVHVKQIHASVFRKESHPLLSLSIKVSNKHMIMDTSTHLHYVFLYVPRSTYCRYLSCFFLVIRIYPKIFIQQFCQWGEIVTMI